MSFQSSQSAGLQPDGRLRVHFLDIGQGDGILITTPSGRQVLVDGGKSPQALFNELGEAMPFWDRSIDMLLLTHPDGDHMIGQISVPERFRVSHALDTAISQANADALPWRESLDGAGAHTHVEHAGGWVDLGDGVALWILWPPPGGFEHEHADNENSLVAKLVYGDFSVLLTGDAGLPSEDVWVRAGVPDWLDGAQGGSSRQQQCDQSRVCGGGESVCGRDPGGGQ